MTFARLKPTFDRKEIFSIEDETNSDAAKGEKSRELEDRVLRAERPIQILAEQKNIFELEPFFLVLIRSTDFRNHGKRYMRSVYMPNKL